jgi:two-component system sensor histidine kinase UhpB
MQSSIRTGDSHYNGLMNLKLYLLIRMTLVGLLCWLGVSIYLVGQSGRRAVEDINSIASELQPMVAADVMRRWTSVDSDLRRPDLAGAAARFPEPLCLRYRAMDGSASDWGCSPSPGRSAVPPGIAAVLSALGPGHISLQRQIVVYGLRVGTLLVEKDDASLLLHEWSSVRELLALAALMLLTVDVLAFWVVGRALQPTAQIVAAVEQLGEGTNVVLPALRPREFKLIASGVNRLAKRLADSYAARAELTARLIRVQEDERCELAHELHEEFGQCVTALGAVGASLRHGVSKGEVLTEADVLPLETGVEHLLSSLRSILQRMSVPPLAQQGLRSAVADLVAGWQAKLYGGYRVVIDADSHEEAPNSECALCAYRVIQECLSNIARHAPSTRTARVSIRQDQQWLKVRVSNDLVEMGARSSAAGTGMGLKLLAERVRSVHGIFSVEKSAVEFVVQAHLPMTGHE